MAIAANFMKTVRFIPVIMNDHRRKSVLRIIRELIYLTLYHGSLPSFYFSRRLYLSEKTNIMDFLPNKFLYGISDRVNDRVAATVLSDKLYFDLYYSRFISQLPKILSYNHGKHFLVDGSEVEVNSSPELQKVLEDLVNNISKTGSVFIKKMYDSYGGMNTFRITKGDLPLEPEKRDNLFSSITRSAYLFQETIIQHPELDRVNPSCINSIRMDTLIDSEGNCEVLSAFLRMSISNTHVDNISSGGCYVGIDLDTGKLDKYGYSAISVTGGNIYTEHPVTGLVFKGFSIPYFEESKAFVKHIAQLNPSLRLIGWDIAITPDGPLLIEGNCGYDITGHDMIYGGYRRNPGFRKLLSELGETKYLK